jgi:hypothetical protein
MSEQRPVSPRLQPIFSRRTADLTSTSEGDSSTTTNSFKHKVGPWQLQDNINTRQDNIEDFRQGSTRQHKGSTRQGKRREGKATRRDETGHDTTRRDKTRKDESRRDGTRRDETGQDKRRVRGFDEDIGRLIQKSPLCFFRSVYSGHPNPNPKNPSLMLTLTLA